jgi:hypothetical protein
MSLYAGTAFKVLNPEVCVILKVNQQVTFAVLYMLMGTSETTRVITINLIRQINSRLFSKNLIGIKISPPLPQNRGNNLEKFQKKLF